jgi:hypothetical protein
MLINMGAIMSFFDKIQHGVVVKPLFVILHSGPGVGKTEFGRSFPSPHFFDLEESSHALNVSRTRPKSYDELMNDLEDIYRANKLENIQSLIFDPIDELARLIDWKVAEEEKKDHILKVGYQKGFEYSLDYWARFIAKLRDIRDKHNTNMALLAHSEEQTVNDSEKQATYKKTTMRLHKKISSYLFGQVEIVLYAAKERKVIKKGESVYVKDMAERFIYTQLSALYDAKNRIGLPPKLKMPPKDAYSILKAASDKCHAETESKVYKECLGLIAEIKDRDDAQSIKEFCDKQKTNKINLRMCRDRLKKRIEKENSDINNEAANDCDPSKEMDDKNNDTTNHGSQELQK